MQVPAAPRVLVVLVAHDGAPWLQQTLDALEAQSFRDLQIVAVDNASTDGSRELLLDRLGHERVLVADRDLGFGAAVSMALDAHADDSQLLWLIHDDLAPTWDALQHLVDALDEDPRLGIVGPKLRDFDDPDRLQSVGWTIDLTGRADSGVDPGELDQGQWDRPRRTLYVSTAGMLLRREVFERLGRFDRRFHLFRDDLDLCWRAWAAGYDVEVVPDAVGQHVAAASSYVRLGQTRFIGPRYFAERNTLATLLKNYSTARLPLVIALYVLVGLAKVAGFLLTRRVSDAWQTVRAWVWNLLHLRETWRLRSRAALLRRRSDRELRELFARITPRVRAYVEAIADWVAGGDHPVAPSEEGAGQEVAGPAEPSLRRVVRRVRQRPVLVAGSLLVLLLIGGAWPLLLPGELRGGELAPWPASAAAFLRDYASGWHEVGAFATSTAPSPAQALLGLLQVAMGGSGYLASRVLVLGSVLVGWVLALRAAQTYSRRRLPRVAAATAYVLSPPALAALVTGRVGGLVTLAVLPGIVAAGLTLTRRRVRPTRAWRSVSAVALLTAIAGAFEPAVLVAVTALGAVVLLAALVSTPGSPWQRTLAIRVVFAISAAWALLLPWSIRLVDPDGPLLGREGDPVGGELWRWLLLSPDLPGFPGVVAGVGFLLAGLLGLVLATRRAPGLVLSLWVAAFAGVVAAWWSARMGSPVWPGLPLMVSAAAFAGLFASAFASAGASLSRFGFGWRQLAAGATAVAVAVSLGAVAVELVRSPWDAYAIDDPALPAFITAAAHDEDFRVLVLADGPEGVRWDVVAGSGPSMAAYGVEPSMQLVQVGSVITDAVDRRDPHALERLGPLGVRYVLVPAGGTSDVLDQALRWQIGVEPRPLADGRLYRIGSALPPVSLVPAGALDRLIERGTLPEDAAVQALRPTGTGAYVGRAQADGAIVIADSDDGTWEVTVDGRVLERLGDDPAVHGEVARGETVRVEHTGRASRRLLVAAQVLVVVLVISLALRPPGFARRREVDADRDGPARDLPAGLWGSEVAS